MCGVSRACFLRLWDLFRFWNLRVIVFIKLESFYHYFFKNFFSALPPRPSGVPLPACWTAQYCLVGHEVSARFLAPFFPLIVSIAVCPSSLTVSPGVPNYPLNPSSKFFNFRNHILHFWLFHLDLFFFFFFITSIFLLLMIRCSFKSMDIFIVAILTWLPVLCLTFPGVFLLTSGFVLGHIFSFLACLLIFYWMVDIVLVCGASRWYVLPLKGVKVLR